MIMWAPILNSNITKIADKKICEIYNVITFDDNISRDKDISLMGGRTGKIIFQYYYGKYINDRNIMDLALINLKEIMFELNQIKYNHDFCSGLSGILWGIEHILNLDLFKYSKSLIQISELDKSIIELLLIDLKNGNIDFLYGSIGSCTYLLEKYNSTVTKEIFSQVLMEIEAIAVQSNDYIKWSSDEIAKVSPGQITNQYFLSIPHGNLSVLNLLSIFYRNSILKEKCKILIDGNINWIKQLQNSKSNVSLFPISDNIGNQYSRLAWCYGDLGVANSLLLTADNIDNLELRNFAIEIALHTCKRILVENTGIIDSGICHGASGVAHIYNRLYQVTKISEFKVSANYWFEHVLNISEFKDGYAGYKTWNHGSGAWELDYSLIEGICGVGLTLICANSNIEASWDRCFSISHKNC